MEHSMEFIQRKMYKTMSSCEVRTWTRYLVLVPSLLPQSLTDWEVPFTARACYPRYLWVLCSLARKIKSKWVVRPQGARSLLGIEFLCYWWAVIALSDYPRWMFRKNSMEFFIGLGYYLYYSTVAVQLLVYNHMSFQNVLWSPDLVTWSDYLSYYAIYISTPLYDLRL